MQLKIYQVDAFTKELFGGNPAAVIPLTEWVSDELLQKIAEENNLSETAFFVPEGEGFRLRWLTPTVEVPLCGHATLASAHVIFEHLHYDKEEIIFYTKSGVLKVKKDNGRLSLNFPKATLQQLDINIFPAGLVGDNLIELWEGNGKWLAVVEEEDFVRKFIPNFQVIGDLPCFGLILTAKGKDVDFVSRFFTPQNGINEDPVTGGAHCLLTPYWANVLGKNDLHALQVSKRGGELWCKNMEERVIMQGHAITYLVGDCWV